MTQQEISTPGNGSPVPQGTQTPGGVTDKSAVTTTNLQGDASLEDTLAQVSHYKTQYEKTQDDLNRMKGSLQRQIEDNKKAWLEDRKALEEERDTLMKKGLNDEEQLRYDLQRERERREQAERLAVEQRAQYEQSLEEQQNYTAWYNKFITEMGVPEEALDKSNLNALYQSGMNYIEKAMKERNAPPETPPAAPSPSSTAPRVHVAGGQGASGYVDYRQFVEDNYGGNEDAMYSDPNFKPHEVFPGLFPK